jgi:hypothetical protein
MLTYTYADAYLKPNVNEEREGRALADVGDAYPEPWKGKLVVLRAYVITALECQAQPDDLFAQKLKHYRAEYDAMLAQSRAATATSSAGLLVFSVPMERA